MNFTLVKDEHIEPLASLASEIWHEYFASILALEQIDYMVERFQSFHALKDQIQHQNYQYYFIVNDDCIVGYTGIQIQEEKLFLSKLYIKKEERQKGYASKTFAFLEELAKKHHLKYIYLTVNKYNYATIEIYEKKGFVKIDAQVNDIGNGFVMDDFIMEKALTKEGLSEEEKILHHLYHYPPEEGLTKQRNKAKEILYEYNQLHPFNQEDRRQELIKDLFKKVGKNTVIEMPFKIDYGSHTIVGDNFFANFGCTILDSSTVIIGNDVMFGPNVGLYTVNHPLQSFSRKAAYEIAKPITIGNEVWIGADATIIGGVSIGDRSVIGAGSVVTHNIPADCVAVGNPAKVIRHINQDEPIEECREAYFNSIKK